jgi:hypothetical protein
MIKTRYCSCNYCLQIIHSFWIVSLITDLFNINKDIKIVIQSIILEYDKWFIDTYSCVVNRIITNYYNDFCISEILGFIEDLQDKEEDYQKTIIFLDNPIYLELFNTMESFLKILTPYHQKFTLIGSLIRKEYERVTGLHQKYKSIKKTIMDHDSCPVLSQKTVDFITNNTLILHNETNEFIRSYLLKRFHTTGALRIFLNLCGIGWYHEKSRSGDLLLFSIEDQHRKIVLSKVDEMCNLCKDKYHKKDSCKYRHCFIICSNSKNNKDCVLCKKNKELEITKCNLVHCDICNAHHFSYDCPKNHCFIICSNNGTRVKRNCSRCIEFNSKRRICNQTHCSKCFHHHQTKNCKKIIY